MVSENTKKKCYEKGISLYKINTNKKQVVSKNVSVLDEQCHKPNNRNVNQNSFRFGVPPRPERVRAAMNKGKMTFNNAYKNTIDPFLAFMGPRYNYKTPIPFRPMTWPVNHEVYMIEHKYFPGPSKKNVINNRKAQVAKMKAQGVNKSLKKQQERLKKEKKSIEAKTKRQSKPYPKRTYKQKY